MDRSELIDEIGFLGASCNRVEILSALSEAESIEKQDLRERFGVSRTTLKRNLNKLEGKGWICERSSNEYQITMCGRIVERGLGGFADAVEDARKLHPFLEWTDPAEFDLDPSALIDADIAVAEQPNPYAPVDKHVRALRETNSFRGCLSVVGREAVEEVHGRLGEIDDTWELVITREVLKTLRSDPIFRRPFEELRTHDGLEIYVHEGEIPFFVGLFDDVVQIGVEDDRGVPQALVSAEDERLLDWAEEYYARSKGGAKRITAL